MKIQILANHEDQTHLRVLTTTQVMTLLRALVMMVMDDPRTVVVMVTNYISYAFHFYGIRECLCIGVSFCEAEYLYTQNPTHEPLLIRALRYERGLQRCENMSTKCPRYLNKYRPFLRGDPGDKQRDTERIHR